jgi:hypothetical protein
LKLEGKTIFYRERFDQGVLLITDTLNDDSIFKTLEEVKDQYDCRINYLHVKYFSLTCKLKCREKINKKKINALLSDTITKHETNW